MSDALALKEDPNALSRLRVMRANGMWMSGMS